MFAIVWFGTTNLSARWLTGAFAIGFFASACALTLGEVIRQIRVWPAIDQVIDWKTVEHLANSSTTAPADDG